MSRRVVTLKTPFPRCLIRRPFYKCKSTPCPFCRSMMSKCGLKCVIHTIQKQSNNKMQSTMSTKDRHVVAVASEREEEGGGVEEGPPTINVPYCDLCCKGEMVAVAKVAKPRLRRALEHCQIGKSITPNRQQQTKVWWIAFFFSFITTFKCTLKGNVSNAREQSTLLQCQNKRSLKVEALEQQHEASVSYDCRG